MPRYNVSIVKQWGTETWSNRYAVFAANLAAAITVGHSIVAIEKNTHSNVASFVAMMVALDIPFSTERTVVGLTGTGAGVPGSDLLPLELTVHVRFHTGSGKPSHKFLRLPLEESLQSGGLLSAPFRAGVLTSYAQPLLDLAEYKDVDGQDFTSATIHPLVRNRQLDRRRRSRPGFHRGWVADGT